MSDNILKEIAAACGGTIHEVVGLPDGSGFATMSMPLPKDHWSTREGHEPPPMAFRMGTSDPRRRAMAHAIREAGRYAYRAATMGGKEPDLDPDALMQNLVVGMLGYWTEDGLTDDSWANPSPVPCLFRDPDDLPSPPEPPQTFQP